MKIGEIELVTTSGELNEIKELFASRTNEIENAGVDDLIGMVLGSDFHNDEFSPSSLTAGILIGAELYRRRQAEGEKE